MKQEKKHIASEIVAFLLLLVVSSLIGHDGLFGTGILFCFISSFLGYLLSKKNLFLAVLPGIISFVAVFVIMHDVYWALLSFTYLFFIIFQMLFDRSFINCKLSLLISSCFTCTYAFSIMLLKNGSATGNLGFESYRFMFSDILPSVEEFIIKSSVGVIAGQKVFLIGQNDVQNYSNYIISLYPAAIYTVIFAVYGIESYIFSKKMRISSEKNCWSIKPGLADLVFLIVSVILLLLANNESLFVAASSFFVFVSFPIFFDGVMSTFFFKTKSDNFSFEKTFRKIVLVVLFFVNVLLMIIAAICFSLSDSFKNYLFSLHDNDGEKL